MWKSPLNLTMSSWNGRLPTCLTAGVLVLAAVFGPARPAAALGLIPLSVERTVFEEGTELCGGCAPNGQNPTSASEVANCELDLFDETVAGIGSTAMQTSILTPDEFSGSGKITLGTTNSNSPATGTPRGLT